MATLFDTQLFNVERYARTQQNHQEHMQKGIPRSYIEAARR